MELTLREAAALLGRKERTLRAQLSRGEVRGAKRDGKWFVWRADLPPTESQRARVQQRADAIRRAVDEALPSRTAGRSTDRRRSVIDVDCFRAARDVWRELSALAAERALVVEPAAPAAIAEAAGELRCGLLELCHGVAAFDPPTKLDALRCARRNFSRALGMLLIGELSHEERTRELALRLEAEVLPALGGLLRWSERLRERRA